MKNQYEIDFQQGYDAANDEWLDRIDKIRAEIIEMTSNRGFLSCETSAIHEDINAVFDKYKAESEE